MKTILTTLNAKYIHSSLALRYLRTYVQHDFSDTEIREYTIKDPRSDIVADLYRAKPDVIAFSIYIWNVEETLALFGMLKKVLPDVRIVVGGPEVSYDTREWMRRAVEVDVIVKGEGEATFHHLLTVFDKDGTQDLDEVEGIVYRQMDGSIASTPTRAKLDLDTIPSPYEDEEDLQELRNRVVYFETSRGCPFSCQFCLSSIESGVRYFSLQRVKQELKRLIDADIKTIKFVDRTFNLNRAYALELFQFLIDNRRNTVFQFEITGDILPPEILAFLNENAPAGLFRFEIGVQSTNDVTNTLVKRRQNFDKLSRTIQGVKSGGKIVQHLDLIAGLPEEDYASFKQTFNDVFAFEPDELQLGFLKMLRGTGMRLRAADFGYVYMEKAPYEIFSTRVLPYDDVLRIKQVEDVLEKYWNDGRLRHTVRYLTRYAYPSAFDFFQSFGAYWQKNGWSKVGQQLEDLFVRLEGFLQQTIDGSTAEVAKSYMICDYLLQFRIRPHRVWWKKNINRASQAAYINWILSHRNRFGEAFTAMNLSNSEIDKHAVIELLPHAVSLDETDAPRNASASLVVVYYRPGLQKGEQPNLFLASVDESITSQTTHLASM